MIRRTPPLRCWYYTNSNTTHEKKNACNILFMTCFVCSITARWLDDNESFRVVEPPSFFFVPITRPSLPRWVGACRSSEFHIDPLTYAANGRRKGGKSRSAWKRIHQAGSRRCHPFRFWCCYNSLPLCWQPRARSLANPQGASSISSYPPRLLLGISSTQ